MLLYPVVIAVYLFAVVLLIVKTICLRDHRWAAIGVLTMPAFFLLADAATYASPRQLDIVSAMVAMIITNLAAASIGSFRRQSKTQTP